MKKTLIILFIIYCFLLFSCASYRLKKRLDPVSKEFYSQVRYIITQQERNIFLNLPPSDREGFIEEFWQKRDPDPGTEVNEFKDDYFGRIEEANLLFKEGSTPGWLQERGRVYITLGPPDNRETYPRGTSFYGKPTEIWYYGFFPIIFIDDGWTGNYKLEPLSAQHISEINKTQVDYGPKVPMERIVFDFSLSVEKLEGGEALFLIEIPYKNIWFAEKENSLQTDLEVSMIAFDQDEKKVWQHQKSYLISLTEEEILELIGKSHLIEVSANFNPGNYTLAVEIENKEGKNRVTKRTEFTI